MSVDTTVVERLGAVSPHHPLFPSIQGLICEVMTPGLAESYAHSCSTNVSYVAFKDGAFAGMCAVDTSGAVRDKGAAGLHFTAVLPTFQRSGARLGERLVRAAETDAQALNFSAIRGYALGKACGFYEKLGYTLDAHGGDRRIYGASFFKRLIAA